VKHRLRVLFLLPRVFFLLRVILRSLSYIYYQFTFGYAFLIIWELWLKCNITKKRPWEINKYKIWLRRVENVILNYIQPTVLQKQSTQSRSPETSGRQFLTEFCSLSIGIILGLIYLSNIRYYYYYYCGVFARSKNCGGIDNSRCKVVLARNNKRSLTIHDAYRRCYVAPTAYACAVTIRSSSGDVAGGVLCESAPRLYDSTDRVLFIEWVQCSGGNESVNPTGNGS
jgi:hypothetical protein